MKHRKFFTRLLALLFCIISICSSIPITASAATITKSATVSSAAVHTSGMFVAKKNTPLRSSTDKLYSTHATIQKNALVEGCGTHNSGKYIIVKVSGKTWYVAKSDLRTANKTTAGSIYTTVNNAPLRNGPYESSGRITTLTKGTAIVVLGQVKNSYNHTFYVVRHNGHLAYIYSKNVKSISKLTLSVSGSTNTMMVGDTLQLTNSTTSNVKIAWASSNNKIASVNISGKATAKSAGTCNITAKIGNILTVNFPVTVKYKWPVSGRVTSEFGWRYIKGVREHHNGIDIGAVEGTPIKAVAAGKVTYSDWCGTYGKLVIITHSDGSKSYYAHCSSILVTNGQNVTAGQQIAKVGSTGRSTGPHLHFEIRINGKSVNPRNYLA